MHDITTRMSITSAEEVCDASVSQGCHATLADFEENRMFKSKASKCQDEVDRTVLLRIAL